ncbi:precorrin-3B C(17)-methyltransferase [Shouchella sp. 1P09AA]|uniref:precorrin-3B C(17)-methyltransferase n=1 Tax=unclassified Shouchella TaxID=2893065 RepID=UPI0039A111AF
MSTSKKGVINVVGISFNNKHLTEEVKETIINSDVIVGHKNFTDSVSTLIRENTFVYNDMHLKDGKEYSFREKRINCAIEHAVADKVVTIISSGDPGIYGMSAYVFPELEKRGLRDIIEVNIKPGITAAQVAASKIGAPLMNGFSLLSLCDDITPKVTIRKRIASLVKGDIVIVLYKLRYNSEYSPEDYPLEKYPEFHPPVERAKEEYNYLVDLLMENKDTDTPITLIKNLGDVNEEIIYGNVGEFESFFKYTNITSILIIGNSETKKFGEYLATR